MFETYPVKYNTKEITINQCSEKNWGRLGIDEADNEARLCVEVIHLCLPD